MLRSIIIIFYILIQRESGGRQNKSRSRSYGGSRDASGYGYGPKML